jgi:hypothetical protein
VTPANSPTAIQSDSDHEVRIGSGTIVVMRLFDVAYAIDLARVEALWAAHAKAAPSRARFSATPPKAMSFGNPPVVLMLGPLNLEFGGVALECTLTASFHDFGAVVLAVRVPLRDCSWSQLVARQRAVEATIGPGADTALWREQWEVLAPVVGPALEKPSNASLHEDYSLILVHEVSGTPSADALLSRIDLVALLSGEERELSDASRQDLLRQRFSYYADDLVVLTWDRAFIYEPRGDSDVADVLEVANAQLLELRYYDELLDAELPRMYDQVEGARRTVALFAARRFAHLARRLYTLVAEVTELTEKVDNALQVTEDVYLARVYSAALNLFRVPSVAAAVDRKLAIIRDTYTALYEEASSRRAELMELAIIVLIIVEIVLALRA